MKALKELFLGWTWPASGNSFCPIHFEKLYSSGFFCLTSYHLYPLGRSRRSNIGMNTAHILFGNSVFQLLFFKKLYFWPPTWLKATHFNDKDLDWNARRNKSFQTFFFILSHSFMLQLYMFKRDHGGSLLWLSNN